MEGYSFEGSKLNKSATRMHTHTITHLLKYKLGSTTVLVVIFENEQILL